MASRTRRKNARKQRQRNGRPVASPDVHAELVVDSMQAIERLVGRFAGLDDPRPAIDAEFHQALGEFVADLVDFEPLRLIEVARMAFLPFAPEGSVAVTPDAGAAQIELIAMIALAAAASRGSDPYPTVEFQAMSKFAHQAKGRLDHLLRLSHLRAVASVDPANQLTMIELLLRGSQVWMRNSSYPDMAEATLVELFDADAGVHTILVEGLGFDAATALAVLEGCHELQVAALNDRMHSMADAMHDAMESAAGKDALDPEIRATTTELLMSAFEPDAMSAAVSIDDLAEQTDVDAATIEKVVAYFRFDAETGSPAEFVDAFMSGNNPMRATPLIVDSSGRVMLAHNALNFDAVKEGLEDYLKTVQSNWSLYDVHRGKMLERRTTAMLNRLLPGATHRDGFLYYLPANETELKDGTPSKYTKRVECDHLILLDDVAIIVEDKAVALSALSRGGKSNRIRTDLTNIVTKAAEQSGRLRAAIERDGGVRLHDEGWLSLNHIREIHTIAVSLDDLTSVTTATADLVRAGLLDLDNIPWTVSTHDLELITQLIERPAEFLLYLRRRREPNCTVMFSAPDELDFFLYYYENGLWVEPDPDQVRVAFPFLPQATAGEIRRYRAQNPALITSRTDALDRWYYSRRSSGAASPPQSKPKMVASPLAELVDELQARGTLGWLSIGATLLEPATSVQHRLANLPRDLLNQPALNHGRSQTIPFTTTVQPTEAWLMVWATRPQDRDPDEMQTALAEYLRAKKHQLGILRGALFLYDEVSRELVDVIYDGHIGELDQSLKVKSTFLFDSDAFRNRLHPNAKRAPLPAASRPSVKARPKGNKRKSRRRQRPQRKRK